LSCRPRLLIADEPTTALDVTVQAQVLRLLRGLQDETGMGMIFITHDMGVVAELADRVAVMRLGRKVEDANVGTIFAAPQHPYTKALLAAVPVLGSLSGETLPRAFDIDGEGGRGAGDRREEPDHRVRCPPQFSPARAGACGGAGQPVGAAGRDAVAGR
jgi:glutathione transport system ATP-binding protein